MIVKETIYISEELKSTIIAIGESRTPKVKFSPMAVVLLEQAIKERNRKKKRATTQDHS